MKVLIELLAIVGLIREIYLGIKNEIDKHE